LPESLNLQKMSEACNRKRRYESTELSDEESKLSPQIIHDKKKKGDAIYSKDNAIQEKHNETCTCTRTVALVGFFFLK
jgi:hypothetical protein